MLRSAMKGLETRRTDETNLSVGRENLLSSGVERISEPMLEILLDQKAGEDT